MTPNTLPATIPATRQAYLVTRVAGETIPLDGTIKGTPWARAKVLRIARYPWYVAGERQPTSVRLLYDDHSIYAQFRCRDRHSSAVVTDLNGPVCQDSCVEFFATIAPERAPDYFNLELNCCGTAHLGFGPGRHGRHLVTAGQASPLRIVSSIAAPTKAESSADRAWWIAVELPFRVIADLAGSPVLPSPGTRWRANFYRCGGQTDPQYACWAPVVTPQPDYHRPEYFRELVFQ